METAVEKKAKSSRFLAEGTPIAIARKNCVFRIKIKTDLINLPNLTSRQSVSLRISVEYLSIFESNKNENESCSSKDRTVLSQQSAEDTSLSTQDGPITGTDCIIQLANLTPISAAHRPLIRTFNIFDSAHLKLQIVTTGWTHATPLPNHYEAITKSIHHQSSLRCRLSWQNSTQKPEAAGKYLSPHNLHKQLHPNRKRKKKRKWQSQNCPKSSHQTEQFHSK